MALYSNTTPRISASHFSLTFTHLGRMGQMSALAILRLLRVLLFQTRYIQLSVHNRPNLQSNAHRITTHSDKCQQLQQCVAWWG